MADYYEFSHVLYKNDDTPGWQLARISGTENAVEKKCKKLFPFFVYFPVVGTEPVKDEYPVTLSPNYVFTFFDWTYSKELKKWFLPDEEIPFPKSKCEKADKFKINFSVPARKNKIDELIEQYNEWMEEDRTTMFSIDTEITLSTPDTSVKHGMFFSFHSLGKLEMFIGSTIKNGFGVYNADEDDLFKFLAWKKDENIIRFKIQDYSKDSKVTELMDVEIPLVSFIAMFESFFNKIVTKHAEILTQIKETQVKK